MRCWNEGVVGDVACLQGVWHYVLLPWPWGMFISFLPAWDWLALDIQGFKFWVGWSEHQRSSALWRLGFLLLWFWFWIFGWKISVCWQMFTLLLFLNFIWGNALNFAEPNLTLLQGVRRNMELTSRRFNWKDKKWLFWGSGPGARERQSKELQFSIMSFSNNRLKMKLLLLYTEIEHQQFHIVQSNRFLSN